MHLNMAPEAPMWNASSPDQPWYRLALTKLYGGPCPVNKIALSNMHFT